jgi:hypothetical protein
MDGPTFSVVIPTYNRARLIGKTLASVFAQTYPAAEVVIVDNCSTDDTAEVLRPLIEAGKVRFIRHDRNYERARSRNTGMEHATSDYVTFLTSATPARPVSSTIATNSSTARGAGCTSTGCRRWRIRAAGSSRETSSPASACSSTARSIPAPATASTPIRR